MMKHIVNMIVVVILTELLTDFNVEICSVLIQLQ